MDQVVVETLFKATTSTIFLGNRRDEVSRKITAFGEEEYYTVWKRNDNRGVLTIVDDG